MDQGRFGTGTPRRFPDGKPHSGQFGVKKEEVKVLEPKPKSKFSRYVSPEERILCDSCQRFAAEVLKVRVEGKELRFLCAECDRKEGD